MIETGGEYAIITEYFDKRVRMEEQLQHTTPLNGEPGIAAKRRLMFADFVFYPAERELYYRDTLCQLEPKMSQLISLLIEVRPNCVSKDALMKALWPDSSVSDWSLARLVSDTRKLIEDDGQQQSIIKTVRGKGFAFVAHADEIIEAYPQGKSTAVTENIPNRTHLNRNSSSRYFFMSLIIILAMLFYFIFSNFLSTTDKINHEEVGHRLEVMREMQKNLGLTKTTYLAQARRRNELNKLLNNKFPEDIPLSSENRLKRRYPNLTEDEIFIFDQIRAMTEGPMFQGNKAIVVLLEQHPELYQELKIFNPLNSHLQIWLNKFDKIFMVREDMCLVYVGTEDGVPFPSDVDNLVDNWIEKQSK